MMREVRIVPELIPIPDRLEILTKVAEREIQSLLKPVKVDELSELRRALEIASEKNVCPRLHAPKQTGCFRIEFFPGNTRHYQLTN